MKATIQDIIVTIFGAISSLFTAVLLSWIERKWNLSIYSFMLWFVIPVGALGSGMVAAGGYYLGSILFHHKPQKIILLNMLAVSLGTYILIQYLDYVFLVVDGRPASEIVSFWKYWEIATSHQSVTIISRRAPAMTAKLPGIELGNWGYIYALLQSIGFALGGFATYVYLASKLYCNDCSRYYSVNGAVSRYTNNPELVALLLANTVTLIKEEKVQEAITLHSTHGGTVSPANDPHLMTQVKIHKCKGCSTNHFEFSTSKWNGKDDWKKIDAINATAFTKTDLILNQQADTSLKIDNPCLSAPEAISGLRERLLTEG